MTPLFRPGLPPALRRLSQLSILFAMASLIATTGGLTILPAATGAGQAILAAFGIAAAAAAFVFGTLINLNRPHARRAGFVAVAVLLPTAVLFGLIAYVAPDSAWLFAAWAAAMAGYAALATHRLVRWPTGSLADEPKSSLGIFLSYRRQDTIETIGRIRDYLCEAFEEDRIFLDVARESAGDDYRAVIERALTRSDVVLVVIGMEWLDATTADGRRRLDDPNDMVRIEIETALARDVRVVPVLVEGAPMPPAARLPPPLQPLAYRSALPLRPDPNFMPDMLRLVQALRASPTNQAASQPAGLPIRRAALRRTARSGRIGVAAVIPVGSQEDSMRHRWMLVLLLAASAAGTYAAQAQNPDKTPAEGLPFRVGDALTLRYSPGQDRDCRVEAIRGPFVKCEQDGRATELWVNITQVSHLEKRR